MFKEPRESNQVEVVLREYAMQIDQVPSGTKKKETGLDHIVFTWLFLTDWRRLVTLCREWQNVRGNQLF